MSMCIKYIKWFSPSHTHSSLGAPKFNCFECINNKFPVTSTTLMTEEKSKHLVSFNQKRAQFWIIYFIFLGTLCPLSICCMSLNLCLLESYLVNLSLCSSLPLCLCMFVTVWMSMWLYMSVSACNCVSVSNKRLCFMFIAHHRKHHRKKEWREIYRNL